MKNVKILAVIFSLMIIIGAGHGIAPLGLLEVFAVQNLISLDTDSFRNNWIAIIGLIALIGHIMLVLSFFFNPKVKWFLSVAGSVLLLAVVYLITQRTPTGKDFITMLFSMPALIMLFWLLILELRTLRNLSS